MISPTERAKNSILIKIASVLLIIGIATGVYLLIIRPWQLNWGATPEEISRTMPGDQLLEVVDFNATRGVTINASPEEIWPWIVQMGHKRAGFYAYDWFDNNFTPSAQEIFPDFQNLEVGGDVPISSLVIYKAWLMEPNQVIVWVGGGDHINGSWVWGLYPLENGATRLVTRLRGEYDWSSPLILMNLWTDWGDFPFMRKSMLGIKGRAEGDLTDSFLEDTLEGALWIGAFFLFVGAVLQILRRNDWYRPWLLALATAGIFMVIFYARPPLWVGISLEIGILIGLIYWRE